MARKFEPFPDPRTAIFNGNMARDHSDRPALEKFSVGDFELGIVRAGGGV
jgi:hypothetical protein